MEKLTGKQNRYLRSIGQKLDPSVVIGQAGLNQAVIEHICALLDAHELIKLRLSEEQGSQRKIAAEEIAEVTNSACAGVVGRTFLLYKSNPELPKTDRINLPKA